MMTSRQIERMLAKLTRLETTLEPMVFAKVDTVAASKYQPNQPCHHIPEAARFTPCQPGDTWGGEKSTCWFRASYQVPDELDGQSLYLWPRIGGMEALLWVDGQPYGIYCSRILQGSHGNHYCNRLVDKARAGQVIEIALEYYAGHTVIGCMPFENSAQTDFIHRFDSLDICLKQDQIAGYLFDLKTVNQLVGLLDDTSFRKAELVNLLTQVHERVYYAPEDAGQDEFLQALSDTAPLLREALGKTNASSAPFAGLIGHSHMDTAWLWQKEETVRKCARTYANQMNLMDQYPEYRFIQSSACHSNMILQHYPQLFARIRERVAEGRYEPNGGVWVECDCNLTSGESMIRQFLWGQRFTRRHFSYTANAFWLPDTFGYSPAIPQIMKGCCVDYFLTTKIGWNDTTTFPYETFYWKGIDGTRVLTHFNKTHIWPDPHSLHGYVVDGSQTHDAIKEKTVNRSRLLSYGFGDGGGGPQFEMIEMARRLGDVDGLPRSAHTTVGQFMEDLEASLVRPSTYCGELYLELHRGTLTNQHTIKRNNRLAEIRLHDLEFLTVRQALAMRQPADAGAIAPLTEMLLINQFHDILPGTSIPEVHDESIRETRDVIARTEVQIAAAASVRPAENQVAAINTLSFARRDVLYLEARLGQVIAGGWRQQLTSSLDGRTLLAVGGMTLQPLSAASFAYVQGQPDSRSAFAANGNTLQTPFARITFDDRGFITSMIDLRNQRELCGQGYPFNTFLMAEDVPAAWDNWDLDFDYEYKLRDCAGLVSRHVISNGAVEYRIRSVYRISPLSTISQDMIFYADSPEVRFETLIDWQDKHRFLKVAFDTSVETDHSRQEVQFGNIRRTTSRNTAADKARFEVPQHKYTDLSETRYGIALLNDCKYGISVHEGQMRLSLHKGGCRPDPRGDAGLHECVYSILPHDTAFSAESVIQPAYCLNYRPIVLQGCAEDRALAMVNQPNIIIETIKPCEDTARAYILRLYEAEGTYTQAILSLGHEAASVSCTNMLEDLAETLPSRQDIPLVFRPFEIKTLRVDY